MMQEYKIYSLNDPDTDEIKYIGITTGNLLRRLGQHRWNARNIIKRKQPLAGWYYTLLLQDKEPSIHLIEVCNEVNWREREQYWIDYYKSQILNIHKGGWGVIFKSEESTANRIASQRKQICQMDESKNIINIFDSIGEATKHCNGSTHSNIGNALKRRVDSAYGFRWCYIEEYETYQHREPIYNITFYAYDINDNFIRQYDSWCRASIELFGKSTRLTSISEAYKYNKPYKGYKFTKNPPP